MKRLLTFLVAVALAVGVFLFVRSIQTDVRTVRERDLARQQARAALIAQRPPARIATKEPSAPPQDRRDYPRPRIERGGRLLPRQRALHDRAIRPDRADWRNHKLNPVAVQVPAEE